MSKLIFKIDKEIDFKNHLIQAHWREQTRFDFKESDKKYFDAIESSKNTQGQWELFEKYSAEFYNEENKENTKRIVKQLQKLWDKVESKYIRKMEEVHDREFPYETIYGVLSTTPRGWGFNFNGDEPWFACLNKVDRRTIDIAMHEIMHSFFIKYFREEYKEKFELSDNQIWMVQESLTIILNLEVGDLRFADDTGYPPHQELRKKIKESWLKGKEFNKVLDEVCQIVKDKYSQ